MAIILKKGGLDLLSSDLISKIRTSMLYIVISSQHRTHREALELELDLWAPHAAT